MAATRGHVPLVLQLAALGADVGTAQNDGVTPLMAAARLADADVVRCLLELGADATRDKQTPSAHALRADIKALFAAHAALSVRAAGGDDAPAGDRTPRRRSRPSAHVASAVF